MEQLLAYSAGHQCFRLMPLGTRLPNAEMQKHGKDSAARNFGNSVHHFGGTLGPSNAKVLQSRVMGEASYGAGEGCGEHLGFGFRLVVRGFHLAGRKYPGVVASSGNTSQSSLV